MRLPQARLLAASAIALAVGVGTPTVLASSAFAATSHASPATAASAVAPAVTAPVTGTFTNSAGTGTFTGTFAPKRFHVVNGVLEATGRLTGTLTSADGTSLGSVSRTVSLPVSTSAAGTASGARAAAAAPAACSILNLVLGPLNLNLLGLVVTLNQVNLNITAVPGAGALLGNLLCAVANLLNGGGALSQISALLNAILALL